MKYLFILCYAQMINMFALGLNAWHKRLISYGFYDNTESNHSPILSRQAKPPLTESFSIKTVITNRQVCPYEQNQISYL